MATAIKADREIARHIARVAARLFAERGYHATPVRVIVEEAGVAKPTLYHYFGSKEGLAQAVLTVPLARLVDSLRALLDGPADPLRRLVAMAEAYLDFSREDPDRARFVHGLFFGPKGPGPAAELVQFADALASPVRRGRGPGHRGRTRRAGAGRRLHDGPPRAAHHPRDGLPVSGAGARAGRGISPGEGPDPGLRATGGSTGRRPCDLGDLMVPWRRRGSVLRKSRFLLGFAAILPGLSGCGAKNQYAPPPLRP